MNGDAAAARDDLAFMRALVQAGGDAQQPFGEGYLAAGVIYGAEMLLHGGQLLGLVSVAGPWVLAIGLGPTVLFLAVLFWIVRRHRGAPANMVSRAIGAVFGAVGVANVALVAVVGSVALRCHSVEIWLIYPCAVFVLQGAAWLAAYALRRRVWLALVGLGWFAAGIGMSRAVGSFAAYVLIAGVSILLLMALPGWVLLRLARKNS
jgi:hypothetical protein